MPLENKALVEVRDYLKRLKPYSPSCLIVDDYPAVASSLKAVLSLASFSRFDLAENGLVGLETFLESPSDIVFLDTAMPVLSGAEFAQILRKKITLDRDPYLVCFTSRDEEDFDWRSAGMDCYVSKQTPELISENVLIYLKRLVNEGITQSPRITSSQEARSELTRLKQLYSLR